MADFLASKTASEVVERRWTVPVDDDDGPESVVLSATGVTVDSDSFEGDVLVMQLSAGTAAATASIVATVTTKQGRTLIQTLYIPIVDSASQIADTARNYCEFALRKVVGFGEEPQAEEMTHCLEVLNSIIANWRQEGADIGAPYPITDSSVIYCPDWAVSALRYNLRVTVYSEFGEEPTAMDVMEARRGLQRVKEHNIPTARKAVYY